MKKFILISTDLKRTTSTINVEILFSQQEQKKNQYQKKRDEDKIHNNCSRVFFHH